jgi:hypothetical protein
MTEDDSANTAPSEGQLVELVAAAKRLLRQRRAALNLSTAISLNGRSNWGDLGPRLLRVQCDGSATQKLVAPTKVTA